jgi:type VI secretion system secreted protein Hcp
MALNAYIFEIEGNKQGAIKGGVTQKGREGWIEILGMSHEIISPRDAASGLATGKRQHKPLNFTAEIDKAYPLLCNSLVSNETINKAEFRFFQPDKSGKERHFYTIKLTNATVAGIRKEMLNNRYPENMQHRERYHCQLTYQKIEETIVDGGITYADDWEAPEAM